MKGIHLILLAVLLCSEHALSLQCYSCAYVQNVGQCQNKTSCETTPSVCYKGSMILPVANGEMTKLLSMGCVSSCGGVSEEIRQLVEKRDPSAASKLEVRDVECCETDLCNGVAQVGRSLWALAGGLLLSLGPALLWTLL